MQRGARNALLAASLLALMTWQVTVRGPFIAWDWPVHEYVDPRVPEGSALTAIDWVSNVGGQRHSTVPILVGVGAWIAYRQRRYRPLIAIVAGLATIFFVGYGIKFGLARTPPADGIDILHGGGQAFPSGHTANAAFTWIFLVVVLFGSRGLRPDRARFRRWLPVAVGWVLVASAIMVFLDYHWLSDISGGWALGALAASVAVAVLHAPASSPPRTTTQRRSSLLYDIPGEEDAMTPAERIIAGFRIAAIAEAISWTGLLIGMLFKYVLSDNEVGVQVFGPVHGVVFLVYLAMTIAVGVVCRWRWTTIALGLAAGIPPFATYAFEDWALRSGRLRRRTREEVAA